MLTTTYNKNQTMQLLGKQYPGQIFTPEILRNLDEIAQARPGETSRDCAYDIFTLGYIYGKRAERKRRKK